MSHCLLGLRLDHLHATQLSFRTTSWHVHIVQFQKSWWLEKQEDLHTLKPRLLLQVIERPCGRCLFMRRKVHALAISWFKRSNGDELYICNYLWKTLSHVFFWYRKLYCLLQVYRGLWEVCFSLLDHLHRLGLPASWTWLSFFSGPDITGIGWRVGEPRMKMRGHTTIPHCSSVGASPHRPPSRQESTASLSLTFSASETSMNGFLEPTWTTEYGQPSTHFWILCQETYSSSFTGTVVLLEKVKLQTVPQSSTETPTNPPTFIIVLCAP